MAQYRVTFKHKPTDSLQDIYLSSADAKTVKSADIKAANKKAVAKATAVLPKRAFGFTSPKDYVAVDVLCVG